jgi:hypothetical protein
MKTKGVVMREREREREECQKREEGWKRNLGAREGDA